MRGPRTPKFPAIGLGFGRRDKLLELPLPLGISFITFTLTALVVDTFSSKFPPTSSPRTVLAYVLFFPHLIAGPILRPIELIPQLEHPRGAFAFRTIPAVAIFTLGLVKKLVFADQVAEVVDGIYAKTALPTGTEALFAVVSALLAERGLLLRDDHRRPVLNQEQTEEPRPGNAPDQEGQPVVLRDEGAYRS